MVGPFATPVRRIIAQAIDAWIMIGFHFSGAYFGGYVATAFSVPGIALSSRAALDAGEAGFLVGFFVWGSAAWFLNSGIMQGITGATIGKTVTSIEVVKIDGAPIGIGTSLFRSLCSGLSILPFGAGLIATLFSRTSRSWHDHLAGTVVIHKGALYPVSLKPLTLVKTAAAESPSPTSLDPAA